MPSPMIKANRRHAYGIVLSLGLAGASFAPQAAVAQDPEEALSGVPILRVLEDYAKPNNKYWFELRLGVKLTAGTENTMRGHLGSGNLSLAWQYLSQNWILGFSDQTTIGKLKNLLAKIYLVPCSGVRPQGTGGLPNELIGAHHSGGKTTQWFELHVAIELDNQVHPQLSDKVRTAVENNEFATMASLVATQGKFEPQYESCRKSLQTLLMAVF